jgi:hypothetical protein
MREALRRRPEGLCSIASVGSISRFGRSFAGRHVRNVGFRAAQSPHGIGPNIPENRELLGLGLLGPAFVLRTDEQAVNEDVVPLVK